MTPAYSLLILGTRTLALEIADWASDIPGCRLAGFVENMDPDRCKQKLQGFPVIWVDELRHLSSDHRAVCGLATTLRSRFILQASEQGMSFATLVHPSAHVSGASTLGEGCLISPGVIIASHTVLGRHVFVNRGALIGHHTTIRDFTTIQPGANIAGACTLEEGVFVGMGTQILDHLSVGAHSVLGAGSVVTRDVPAHVQVMGIPAKTVKTNISGK